MKRRPWRIIILAENDRPISAKCVGKGNIAFTIIKAIIDLLGIYAAIQLNGQMKPLLATCKVNSQQTRAKYYDLFQHAMKIKKPDLISFKISLSPPDIKLNSVKLCWNSR